VFAMAALFTLVFSRTTLTIRNVYSYHYYNTRHVPLGVLANIIANFQDTGLRGCFAVWQV
jgi:hypothetical protein